MSNYIKAITVAATATAAAEFILIPVDGVMAITFGGTPGASHILNIYYLEGTGSNTGNGRQFLVNVTIPNANTTTAAAIRTAFYKAMSFALQNPGSLPLLLENDTIVTSAAAGSAAL
tara:strand:- start:2678 stop:3028 length:351 start_codon:yes stop_codon:yes gene_type:complete